MPQGETKNPEKKTQDCRAARVCYLSAQFYQVVNMVWQMWVYDNHYIHVQTNTKKKGSNNSVK